jgi:hypothetical protein
MHVGDQNRNLLSAEIHLLSNAENEGENDMDLLSLPEFA